MTRKILVTDEQLGQLARRQHDLFRRVREGTLPFNRVLDELQRLIESLGDVYRVTVDRPKTLAEMIEAGQYDRKNSDITAEHFKIEGSGIEDVDLILRHHNRTMSTDAILADLDEHGLRPAKIEELLALGADPKTRDLQRQFPIIALGSVWRSTHIRRYVPCLYGHGSERSLDLDWIEYGWHGDCRFVAVRQA